MPGSSPRVRGTGARGQTGRNTLGIIPARAGNSCDNQKQAMQTRDHPRACGEQFYGLGDLCIGQGSSPRVRGTGGAGGRRRRGGGIIPARAGNSRQCPRSRSRYRDHPRACGEQPAHAPQLQLGHGIIPARAGNRRRSGYGARSGWDHPRACGEQETVDRAYFGN